MTQRVHIRIFGRVQGVFYRQWTMTSAREKGLSGWVRNRVDGTVEAVFEGEDEAVSQMVQLCYRGSPRAFVTKIEHMIVPDATMPDIKKGEFCQQATV